MKKGLLFLIFSLVLLFPNVSANLLTDGSFESVRDDTVEACWRDAVGLCGWCGHNSFTAPRPTYWIDPSETRYFVGSLHSGSEYAFNGTRWTFEGHDGEWAATIFWQPPSNCTVNTTTHTCFDNWNGTGFAGYIQQKDIHVDNSSFELGLWYKKCPYPPPKKISWWCGNQYYGIGSYTGDYLESPTGDFKVIMETNATDEWETLVTATDEWQHVSFDFSQKSGFSNITGIENITFRVYPTEGSMYMGSVCVVIDNVTLDYTAPPPPTPVSEYISDMTEVVRKFPVVIDSTSIGGFHNCGTGPTSFEAYVSKYFDGTPLLKMVANFSCGESYTTLQNEETDFYYPGKITDASSSISSSFITGYNPQITMTVPFIYYMNSTQIKFKAHMLRIGYTAIPTVFFHFDGPTLTVIDGFSDYGNVLNNSEILTGYGDLFPVIIYNNSIDGSLNHWFSAYNFRGGNEYSFQNTIFEKYDEDGIMSALSTESITFPAGASQYSYNWFYEYNEGDYILMKFYSDPSEFAFNDSSYYTSNTTTKYEIIPEFFCMDYCDGDDYHDGSLIAEVCSYKIYENDTRCITPPTPPVPPTVPTSVEPFVNATREGLNTTYSYFYASFGWEEWQTKALIWILLTVALSAGVSYGVKSWEIGAFIFFAMFILGAILTWMPAWVTIIFIVIAGFAVTKIVRGSFFQ